MSLIAALILGVVQGLTEFLPVSSSGHLVLGGALLGLHRSHLLFDILVHVATLVATLYYYRRETFLMARESWQALLAVPSAGLSGALAQRPEARLSALILVASVPTGIIGLTFKDAVEGMQSQPAAVSAMLLVTAAILIATRFVAPGSKGPGQFGIAMALVLGIAQGGAIIPGISRSGTTIACAMFLGVERSLAARFSFLMSVPAILGALLLQIFDADGAGGLTLGAGVVGLLSAAVVGVVALRILVPLVTGGRLHYFAWYLVPAGLIGWLVG